jgi:hypothetical protein
MTTTLDEETYAKAIDIYHAREKARLLARLREASKTRGPWRLHDPLRNLVAERLEEYDDARGYEIAKLVEDGDIRP